MTTQSIHIQSPDQDPDGGARRIRGRRRSAPALAAGRDHATARASESPDRPDATHQAGGARILRRWSVADLIARATVAQRALA
jgi:hypothetical protein